MALGWSAGSFSPTHTRAVSVSGPAAAMQVDVLLPAPGGGMLLALGSQCPPDVSSGPSWTLSRFTWDRKLGGSSESSVFQGLDLHSRRDVALKLFDLTGARAVVRQSAMAEAAVHAAADHPHILPLWAAFQDGEYICLVMPRASTDLMHALPNVARSEAVVAKHVLGPLLSALAYLHGRGVLHRDVKLENCMVEQGTNRVLLADFGLALHISGRRRALSEAGTLGCRAPEVMLVPISGDKEGYAEDARDSRGSSNGIAGQEGAGADADTGADALLASLFHSSSQRDAGDVAAATVVPAWARQARRRHKMPRARRTEYGPGVDVWSLGVLAWDILVGTELFPGQSVEEVLGSMERGVERLLPSSGLSLEAGDFMLQCLEWDAAKRPTALELFGHPLIRGNMSAQRWQRLHPSNFLRGSLESGPPRRGPGTSNSSEARSLLGAPLPRFGAGRVHPAGAHVPTERAMSSHASVTQVSALPASLVRRGSLSKRGGGYMPPLGGKSMRRVISDCVLVRSDTANSRASAAAAEGLPGLSSLAPSTAGESALSPNDGISIDPHGPRVSPAPRGWALPPRPNHGTHVSSILGAVPEESKGKGKVAPAHATPPTSESRWAPHAAPATKSILAADTTRVPSAAEVADSASAEALAPDTRHSMVRAFSVGDVPSLGRTGSGTRTGLRGLRSWKKLLCLDSPD